MLTSFRNFVNIVDWDVLCRWSCYLQRFFCFFSFISDFPFCLTDLAKTCSMILKWILWGNTLTLFLILVKKFWLFPLLYLMLAAGYFLNPIFYWRHLILFFLLSFLFKDINFIYSILLPCLLIILQFPWITFLILSTSFRGN